MCGGGSVWCVCVEGECVVCVCVEGVYMCVCGGGSVCVVSVCGDYIHGFRIDDLGWEGNSRFTSVPAPRTSPRPASRIHCCHMIQSIVSFPDLGLTPAERSNSFQQYPCAS